MGAFLDEGLVTLTRNAGDAGRPPADIPDEQARALLMDPGNWWSPDGVRPVALAPTDAGLAVYRGAPAPGTW